MKSKLNKSISKNEFVNSSVEKVKFLLSETHELQELLKLHYLKVLTSLKKFNSSNNYQHVNSFMFRNFSFHVSLSEHKSRVFVV